MKKIFLLILTALAFASCTLYMDEPEDEKKGKDDNIENGDGFSSPRTDVTADGTTTYQFNPHHKSLRRNKLSVRPQCRRLCGVAFHINALRDDTASGRRYLFHILREVSKRNDGKSGVCYKGERYDKV